MFTKAFIIFLPFLMQASKPQRIWQKMHKLSEIVEEFQNFDFPPGYALAQESETPSTQAQNLENDYNSTFIPAIKAYNELISIFAKLKEVGTYGMFFFHDEEYFKMLEELMEGSENELDSSLCDAMQDAIRQVNVIDYYMFRFTIVKQLQLFKMNLNIYSELLVWFLSNKESMNFFKKHYKDAKG